MNVIPCMGGWCGKRDQCGHYHSTATGLVPQERLARCPPGRDRPLVMQSGEVGDELRREEAVPHQGEGGAGGQVREAPARVPASGASLLQVPWLARGLQSGVGGHAA